jgi:hypothetical protein
MLPHYMSDPWFIGNYPLKLPENRQNGSESQSLRMKKKYDPAGRFPSDSYPHYRTTFADGI